MATMRACSHGSSRGAGVDDGRRPAEEEQQAEEGQQREEEAGRREAGEHGESREVVGPAASLPAGDDAEGEPHEERQREGVEGEKAGDGELSRELGSDGLAVDEGVAAEGAVEHGAEPAGVLHGEGVVEAELGAEGLTDLGRVGGLAAAGEDGGSDVAGEGAHDGEDNEGREERRRQDEGESAGEVGVRHGDGRAPGASRLRWGDYLARRAWGAAQAPVQRIQRAVQRFGEGHVPGVVASQVVPQRPNPMGIGRERLEIKVFSQKAVKGQTRMLDGYALEIGQLAQTVGRLR